MSEESHESGVGQSLEHEAAQPNGNRRFGVFDSSFIVAGPPSGLVKPTEGALDDPALAHDLEVLGLVAAADNVQMEFAKATPPFDPLRPRHRDSPRPPG